MIAAARAVHFATAMLLFGSLLLALTVAAPIWRRGAAPGHQLRLLHIALICSAYAIPVSVVSGALWLVAGASVMSGTPMLQAATDGTLGVVLSGTVFGRLWIWRLGLVVALGLLLFGVGRASGTRSRVWLATVALVVSGTYLTTLAWSGHAAAAQASGAYLQIVADIVHLLAAGAWVGALPGLVLLLGCGLPRAVTIAIVRRFSTLGVLSVGLIVASGLGNAWYLVGGVPELIGTDYGRVLLAKLAIFAAMLALAAVNRLALTARLASAMTSAGDAVRLLRRNAALETVGGMLVVVLAGVLGVMVPAAHQSPDWPFGYTLTWQAAQTSVGIGAAAVACAMVTVIAAAIALGGFAGREWRRSLPGLAVLTLAAATCAWLLAVPAYRTTYAMSPVRYTTDVIAKGADLYAGNCIACHGLGGRGDGPLALSLPSMPTDVAAHASGHRVGELFWWIAHGIPNTPMPAFAQRLSDDEIWDVVQFLRAQSDAIEVATLTTRVQPWRSAILAPDFSFELGGPGQQSLRQPQGNGTTLLVFYTMPQSLSFLRALTAEAANFAEIGMRVVALPMSANAGTADALAGGEGGPIVGSARADVIAAYAMLARDDGAAPGAVPSQVDFLIDRQGYIRARWIGIASAPSARAAEIFDQADLLRRETQRAPMTMTHSH